MCYGEDRENAVANTQDAKHDSEKIEELNYRISELESDIKHYNDVLSSIQKDLMGYNTINIKWIQGSHISLSDNTFSRVKNQGYLFSHGNVSFSLTDGYLGAVMIYDYDNEKKQYIRILDTGWHKDSFTVENSSGKHYTVCLRHIEDGKPINPNEGNNMKVIEIQNESSIFYQQKKEIQKHDKDVKTSATVRSIAHRGDRVRAPQGTAPAYILARKKGFMIAENDLNISKDGHYIMWHDPTLRMLARQAHEARQGRREV